MGESALGVALKFVTILQNIFRDYPIYDYKSTIILFISNKFLRVGFGF